MGKEKELSGPQKAFGIFTPAPADISDKVLFGEVWERTNLSPCDLSLARSPA